MQIAHAVVSVHPRRRARTTPLIRRRRRRRAARGDGGAAALLASAAGASALAALAWRADATAGRARVAALLSATALGPARYEARRAAADGDCSTAVVVLHEFFGLTARERALADALAARPGVAVAAAPDVFQGEGASLIPRAIWLALRPGASERAVRDAVACSRALLRERSVRRVVLVGFCFGGGVASRAAADLGGATPFAVFYGAPLRANEDAARLGRLEGTRALLVYGGRDAQFPAAAVDDFEAALRGAGAQVECRRFPERGHAFLREVPLVSSGRAPTAEMPENTDAAEAWEALLDFVEGLADAGDA